MPPVRLEARLKPDLRRKSTALALRAPLLQCTTISRLESSSCNARRQIAKRNQMPLDVDDLILMRLAHIEHENVFLASRRRLSSSG
jgi:hypothetical protein